MTRSSIVLDRSGERAFAAGADIAELPEPWKPLLTVTAHSHGAHLLLLRWVGLPEGPYRGHRRVTPSAVAAAGHGRRHHLLASSSTLRLGQPEINLGIIPGFGARSGFRVWSAGPRRMRLLVLDG